MGNRVVQHENAKEQVNSPDWALKRYDTLLRYQVYENQAFWTRTQLYFVANTTMLGFTATTRVALLTEKEVTWEAIATVIALCLLGILITILWWRLVQAGIFWIEHWEEAIRDLEPAAFEHRYKLHEGSRQYETYGIFTTVRFTVRVFGVIWTLLLALGVYVAYHTVAP